MNPTHEPLRIFELTEDDDAVHWVVATSTAAAIALVAQTDGITEGREFTTTEISPDARWRIDFVDGFDDPDRWELEGPPGAERTEHPQGWPVLTATAAEWTEFIGQPCYIGCSEC